MNINKILTNHSANVNRYSSYVVLIFGKIAFVFSCLFLNFPAWLPRLWQLSKCVGGFFILKCWIKIMLKLLTPKSHQTAHLIVIFLFYNSWKPEMQSLFGFLRSSLLLIIQRRKTISPNHEVVGIMQWILKLQPCGDLTSIHFYIKSYLLCSCQICSVSRKKKNFKTSFPSTKSNDFVFVLVTQETNQIKEGCGSSGYLDDKRMATACLLLKWEGGGLKMLLNEHRFPPLSLPCLLHFS